MAESWEYKLAGEFKARNNPKPLGACIGKVESLEPVIISIQSGKFMLRANQIYICNQILERKSKFHDFKASHKQEGRIGITHESPKDDYWATGDIECTGSVHLEEVWKVGDYVMVVPDESGQHFFIVDILRGVS